MSPRVALRLTLTAAVLLTAACAHTAPALPAQTGERSRIEGTMTPEQAADALQHHLELAVAAIRQMDISEVHVNLDDMDDPSPCGGLAGTEFSELESGIYGVVGVDEWNGRAEAARVRVNSALSPQGYRAMPLRERRDGRKQASWDGPQPEDSDKGFYVTLYFKANGAITVSGSTPCLPDPDAIPGF